MWFVDVICCLDWFVGRDGKLGKADVRQLIPAVGNPTTVTALMYCSDFEVKHLRMLIDVQSHAEAGACSDRNVQHWIRLLEVSTGLLCATSASAQVLPGTNSFMTILGEGDEQSPSVQVQRR